MKARSPYDRPFTTVLKLVSIYRTNGEVEVLDDPESVSGEDVLPGFELNVRQIW